MGVGGYRPGLCLETNGCTKHTMSRERQKKLRQLLGGGGSGVFMKAEVGGRGLCVLVREAKNRCWRSFSTATRHTGRRVISPRRGDGAAVISVGFPDRPSYLGSEATPSASEGASTSCECVMKPLLIILSAGVTSGAGRPPPRHAHRSTHPRVRYLPSTPQFHSDPQTSPRSLNI